MLWKPRLVEHEGFRCAELLHNFSKGEPIRCVKTGLMHKTIPQPYAPSPGANLPIRPYSPQSIRSSRLYTLLHIRAGLQNLQCFLRSGLAGDDALPTRGSTGPTGEKTPIGDALSIADPPVHAQDGPTKTNCYQEKGSDHCSSVEFFAYSIRVHQISAQSLHSLSGLLGFPGIDKSRDRFGKVFLGVEAHINASGRWLRAGIIAIANLSTQSSRGGKLFFSYVLL